MSLIGSWQSVSSSIPNPLARDLDHILKHTSEVWEGLRGQRLFITGGTGFFGCWLLESLLWAIDRLGLETSAVVLTRDSEAFRRKAPHLAMHPAIQLHVGDVRSFEFPAGAFSHVIHMATEASARLNLEDPLLMVDTIVQGTQHTLGFARECGAKRFLLTSSGAVYGKQPAELTHIPEDHNGAPDTTDACSAYGEAKRLAELLCAIYAEQHGIETTIARCFAFVGPYLPLNTHFAIGNFIRDAMQGGPIHVNGNGTPYRSYLYAADLVIWLWTILFKGKSCRPYNVGSEHALTVGELAQAVAQTFFPPIAVRIAVTATPGEPVERYVPATGRAANELGLHQWCTLTDSLRRTAGWHETKVDP